MSSRVYVIEVAGVPFAASDDDTEIYKLWKEMRHVGGDPDLTAWDVTIDTEETE